YEIALNLKRVDMAKCEDEACHNKVLNHNETLYDKEYGLKAKIHNIELCLKDKVSKVGIRYAIYGSLAVLMAIFIALNTMWAETRDTPERRTAISSNKERIVRLEERFNSFEKQQEVVLENTEEILRKLPDR
ncbi:MAG: hypothetical protein KKD77_21135, partial [Gammaproteobacteria bacterium]|nr:hypothetical protein [Gammaproteobacteria bacterium]